MNNQQNNLIIQHGDLIGKVLGKHGLDITEYNLDRVTKLVINDNDPKQALNELLKK